jgi:O-antigen/teichoic acid export membrane protein
MSDKKEEEQGQQEKQEHFSAYGTARGAVYITVKNLLVGIAGSLFFIFIARFLPHVADLGLIHGLQILIVIGVTLACLGLTNAATRFIPYHIGSGRKDLAKQISTLIFRIGLISSFIMSVILFLAANYVATIFFHNANYTDLVRLTSVDVFFYGMVTFANYILYSFQEFKKVAIILIANSLIKFSAAFVLLILGLGIDGIIMGLIFGDIMTFFIFIWLLRPQIRTAGGNISSRVLRDLLNYSVPIFGSQIFFFLSVNIDYYLVLILSGLFTAGIYSPAVLIVTMFLVIIQGSGETLLPYFSRLYGKSGIESLKNASIFTSRYVFLLYFPLGFAMLASSSPLIILVFGQKYSESIYPAVILILATTLTSLGIIFNYILMSAGYSRLFLISTLIALVVQILLSVAAIPLIGASGAALARASAFAIGFLYPAYRLKQIAGLHYDIHALRNGLIGSVVMATTILILNYYFIYPSYLPLNLLVGFLSYLLFLRFSRTMKIQDFETIDNILSHKLTLPIRFLSKIVIR